MPGKILLLSANRCVMPDAVFPLGLAFLHAALREAGHPCVVLDRLVDLDRLQAVLDEFKPDYVGISLRNIDDVAIRKRETFFGELASIGAAIRSKTSRPVILGGSGFSLFPERLLHLAEADFGIAGEGERGLLALLDALDKGADYSHVPGLVYRKDSRIVINKPAPAPLHRSLAEADRPQSLTQFYLATSGVLNVQSQRGCSFRCCYCTYPVIEGKQHRFRPPELVADDFEQLQRQGGRYAFIVDSVFNSSERHVVEVCEAILRRNLKLSWGCFLRPAGLTPELMGLMARAGLRHIDFGSDSLCDEVLAEYQKGFTFDEILRSSQLARQNKVEYCHFLICGGPGETMDTLRRTYENSRRLDDPVIMAVVGMRVYPGTPLFQRAVAEGRLTPQTDLLEPAYYLAAGLSEEALFAHLQQFARVSPNWIVGDPQPAYTKLVERLRQRGVIGPLWSYFSLVQRLWPQPASTNRPA